MKRRSSNQIRNLIIVFVVLMMMVLIGLIIFLLTVDVKNVRNYGNNEQNSSNVVAENNEQEDINISDYELIEISNDGDIEIRLSDKKIMFSVKDESAFAENYPDSVIDINKNATVAIHENTIEDICIGIIDEKNYLIVLTDQGSIGIMDIDEAVETDVFRIKNKLISFEKPVIKMMGLKANSKHENSDTVIVITQDGKKYDLAKFVE